MPLAAISSDAVDPDGRGYPRPQLRRATWYSLNGAWSFALDPDGKGRTASDVSDWSQRIRVPFAPEAPLSGVGHTGFFRACWYRLQCELPRLEPGGCWRLRFGAGDGSATGW